MFSFKIKTKEITKPMEQAFMERMKDIILINVKNATAGVSRRPLDVTVNIRNGILTVKVVDLSSKGKVKSDDDMDEAVSSDEFFNVTSEDSFKNKVEDGVKNATKEIAAVLQSVESFYRQ